MIQYLYVHTNLQNYQEVWEWLEDIQDFDEDTLSDVVPLDAGEYSSNDEGNEYFVEGGDK